MDETAVFPCRITKVFQVAPAIIVCVEHRLPVIASLNDVLGHPGQDKSEPSCHVQRYCVMFSTTSINAQPAERLHCPYRTNVIAKRYSDPKVAKGSREVVAAFHRDATRVLQGAELRERLTVLGSDPEVTTPEQFGAFIKSESDKWARVAKRAGVYQSQ